MAATKGLRDWWGLAKNSTPPSLPPLPQHAKRMGYCASGDSVVALHRADRGLSSVIKIVDVK